MRIPLGFLGFPSVQSVVEGLVKGLARALVPDFLKHAGVGTIKWLVAVPNPTGWRHVGELASDLRGLSVSVLGVCFTAAIVRNLLGLGGQGNPLRALADTLVAAGWLLAYPWAAGQAIAAVNTMTNAILSFPVVGDGLQRTAGVLFGTALLVGAGGVFLAVLVIVAVGFIVVVCAIKVLLLIAVGGLYLTGTLAIATKPLPELSHFSRAWGSTAAGIAIVPFGWTILFALAGALSLDATSFGTGGGMSGHVAAAFAALITFYLAAKLPFATLGRLRSSLVHGALGATGVGSSGGRSSSGQGLARVSQANARLRNVAMATGRRTGEFAGRLGAPEGGPAGAAGRAAKRLAAAGFAGVGGVGAAVLAARGLRRARSSGRQGNAGAGAPGQANSTGQDGRGFTRKRRHAQPPRAGVGERSRRRRPRPAHSAGDPKIAHKAAGGSASPRATGKKGPGRSQSRRGAHRRRADDVRQPATRPRKPASPRAPSKRPAAPANTPRSPQRPVTPASDGRTRGEGRRAPSKPLPRIVEPRKPKTPKPDRGGRRATRRPGRTEG